VRKNGFSKVLLGVSGGIDSALVAAIAVDALGSENVRGVILPTKYSSKITMEDAYGVCKALGISAEEHEVWDNYKREEGIVAENMQSRTRGIMLMALSNKHNELLLTTGNKSEIAVGYCTIYGDMNGAYNPIKDLYKTEVYAVAKWLGKLPPRVLEKAPTAELKDNQTDQDTLPPYDVLDAILFQLVEQRKTADDIEGYEPALVAKVAHMLKLAEFKRRQAAPGAKLSKVSFGKDWRMPITRK
jgi:NAD+ synthetase